MSIKEKHYKISNGEVQLAVSETGQGQTLLFFNGGGATQVSWKRLIHELHGPYRLVTFDFRNHGKTTRSSDVSFKRFLSDTEAVMDKVAGPRPLVVGWSLGADLAVWYAATHPGRVAGLFLIDGAVPVNLVADPEDVKRRLDTPAMKFGPLLLSLVGMGYRLTPSEYAALTIELNMHREQLLSAYDRLIVLSNWSWQRNLLGKRERVLSATMRGGGLAVNNSRACTRHILSSGWTTPTSFRSKNQQRSHDLSTRLPNAFGLALPPNRKPATITGCPRSRQHSKWRGGSATRTMKGDESA
jgi:pimeloyl-ACP methyl ester carboxylesterase